MSALNEKSLLENLDFKCARCQAECTKINAVESELGYISKVDGTFVGPICQACFNELPTNERAVKKVPETAFMVVIRQDGEGAYMVPEVSDIQYMREPTYNDIITGCETVGRDIKEALFAKKLMANFVAASSKKNSRLVLP